MCAPRNFGSERIINTERGVKRLKARVQARGTQHGRVSDLWKYAFRHFDTLDLRSLGICRAEAERRAL